MAVSLPSEVDFLRWVVGSDWPEADEDALRRCGAAWTDAAARLRALLPDTLLAGEQVQAAVQGEIAERFAGAWGRLAAEGGALATLAEICDELAAACEHAAREVEYAKYLFVAALVALAIQIAILIAAMAGSFGASAAGIPVAVAATTAAVRVIAIRLVQAMILGAVSNVAIDAAAQLAQVIRHTRDNWDLTKTGRAAQDGAMTGAIGGGVFLAGGRLAPDLMATGYGRFGAAGVTGAVGGAAVPLAHGELPTGADLLLALTGGIAGGAGPDLIRSGSPGTGPLSSPDLVQIRLAGSEPAHRPGPVADRVPITGDALRPDGGTAAGGDGTQTRPAEPPVPATRTGFAPVHRISEAASLDPTGMSAAVHWRSLGDDPSDASAPGAGTHPPAAGESAQDASAMVFAGAEQPRDLPRRDHLGQTVAPSTADGLGRGVGAASMPHPGTVAEPGASAAAETTPGLAGPAAAPVATSAGGATSPASLATDPAASSTGDRPTGPAPPSREAELPELAEYSARPLSDTEAVALARASLLVTDAGLAFYPDGDEIRDFAAAIEPTEGFVTIDLHGGPDGFEIDGGSIAPAQFAAVLRQLRDEGVIDLPAGTGIKLLSCDTAVGGNDSPAAQLARLLEIVVVAPDQLVWTALDGEEIVASATLVDGRWSPADPPDGQWHAFGPSGTRIPLPPQPAATPDLAELGRTGTRWRPSSPRAPTGMAGS